MIGFKAGMAGGAAVLLALSSIKGAMPDMLMVFTSILTGVVVYHFISGYVLLSVFGIPLVRPRSNAPTVEDEPEDEPLAVVAPQPPVEPLDTVKRGAGDWFAITNWTRLLAHVQASGGLSRSTLNGLVDQRFYSPRDGDESVTAFPELMVAIGAAVRVNNGGSLAGYEWGPSAEERLYDLINQIHGGAGRIVAAPPTLSLA
jgi:hypothetical protein